MDWKKEVLDCVPVLLGVVPLILCLIVIKPQRILKQVIAGGIGGLIGFAIGVGFVFWPEIVAARSIWELPRSIVENRDHALPEWKWFIGSAFFGMLSSWISFKMFGPALVWRSRLPISDALDD